MKVEIAWAAGILEGEGCFSVFKRKDRPNTTTCSIHLEMTDEDIIRRVRDVFNVGTVNIRQNVTGRSDKRPRKVSWIWSVQNKTGVRSVLEAVLPYLGDRRTKKAKELLECM